jgi:hypothetical protein
MILVILLFLLQQGRITPTETNLLIALLLAPKVAEAAKSRIHKMMFRLRGGPPIWPRNKPHITR